MPSPSTTPFRAPQSALMASTRLTIATVLGDRPAARLVARGGRRARLAPFLPWRFTGPRCRCHRRPE